MIDNKNFYEAVQVIGKYMEVSLQDAEFNEYIYWVDLSKMPEREDEWDWSLERAKKHHAELGLAAIPEDSDGLDDEPYASACDPVSRYENEFVFVL